MYYAHIAVMNAASIAADNTEEGATQSQFLDAVKIVANLPAYTVNSQASFNALFTRTSANVYDINASITSVVFKPGNYLISGILSGGDTWGDIQTNNCITLKAENGTTIDFAALRGKLLVETENCLVEHVHVTGSGATVASLDVSIEGSAGGLTFRNCKISNRVSSEATGTDGFLHSGTEIQKLRSRFENCEVTTCGNTVATFKGFNEAKNIINSIVYSLSSAGSLRGFTNCANIVNSQVYDLTSSAGTVYAFNSSDQINNCKAYDLETTGAGAFEVIGFRLCDSIVSSIAEKIDIVGTGSAYGFNSCLEMSACKAYDIATTGAGTAYGFSGCERLSGCYADAIDNISTGVASGFNLCLEVSACKAYDIATTGAGTAYGFSGCERLSGCYAEKIDTVSIGSAYGFSACLEVSACKAKDIDTTGAVVYGFSGCDQISGCSAEDIQSASAFDAIGFNGCDRMSACRVDVIDNTSSGDAYGFKSCQKIAGCEANDIDTAGAGAAYGFSICSSVSACESLDIDAGGTGAAIGFNNCDYLSSCNCGNIDSVSGTAEGYKDCSHGAALDSTEAVNSGNDWMDSADAQITNNYSVQDIFT
jgi:hypothetical protein